MKAKDAPHTAGTCYAVPVGGTPCPNLGPDLEMVQYPHQVLKGEGVPPFSPGKFNACWYAMLFWSRVPHVLIWIGAVPPFSSQWVVPHLVPMGVPPVLTWMHTPMGVPPIQAWIEGTTGYYTHPDLDGVYPPQLVQTDRQVHVKLLPSPILWMKAVIIFQLSLKMVSAMLLFSFCLVVCG